jgi:peptidoglycan/xylan/chitin deacetylase (PgdA/CDA1 family)
MEHDCPPFLTGYEGVVHGTPRILAALAAEGVCATFFTTGDVARKYAASVQAIVDAGHELGCHGDTHRRFGAMTVTEAQDEIAAASATLRAFAPVASFRAPNLDFPDAFLPLLREAGYSVDSSQGRHKPGSFFKPAGMEQGVMRVPASTMPSVVRLPAPVRRLVLSCLEGPAVLFFHPWEFIDMSKAPIRYDCRFGTGERAVATLIAAIRYFKARGDTFVRMQELAQAA